MLKSLVEFNAKKHELLFIKWKVCNFTKWKFSVFFFIKKKTNTFVDFSGKLAELILGYANKDQS